jgi:predicted ABC-type ATPase
MLGGGPASGKTTVVNSGQTDIPSRDKAVHINADDVKEMLPENGRMRMSQDDRDYFHAAEFVHEESSILAKRVQSKAIGNKQDIVLDGTGDSAIGKLATKVEQARQAGYKVNGVYVTVPTEVAWARASERALGESRRFVPESVVRSTHADVSVTLPKAIEGGLFDSVSLWDNSGSTVKKIGQGQGSEFVIYDAKGWSDFLAKGKR